MLKVIVNGATGRMGGRIVALMQADARFDLVAALGRDDDDARALQDLDATDVVIDFSTDEGVRRSCDLARRGAAALLVGTTGLTAKTLDEIEVSARSVPVMVAPNTARGVAVLSHLVVEAARRLGPDFTVDLIEHHHVAKRDAPSGTARRIVDRLRADAGIDLPSERVHSVRAGDIAGEHQVEFTGPEERLKICHLVAGRDVFARGALDAASWLAGRSPGRHTIEQALGLAE